jgi:hypothetical protein
MDDLRRHILPLAGASCGSAARGSTRGASRKDRPYRDRCIHEYGIRPIVASALNVADYLPGDGGR